MRKFWKGFLLCWSFCPSLSLCPQQESQVFALLVSQSASQCSQSHVGHSSSFRHGWLRVGLPGDRRDHRRLLSQRAALGILRQHLESRSHIKCQVRLTKNSFSLSSRNFFPAPKHSVFKILSDLRFHKTSFPQNFFSTFCHRGKECTVSSFAGFDCQKAQKKGTGQFCKVFISLKCRIPRKSVDYQTSLSANFTLDSCPPSQAEDLRGVSHWQASHPQDPQDGQVSSEEQEEGEHLQEHDDGRPR